MVENQTEHLDLLFHALSDGTRRKMLARLSKNDANVTELAAPHDQSFAGISKHLKVLEDAGLVKKKKVGRVMVCKANLKPLDEVYTVLEELGQFWRGRLDALEDLLVNEKDREKEDGKRSSGKLHTVSRRKKGSSRG
jgi:DNA-binding transcriptional ArsR family regulator